MSGVFRAIEAPAPSQHRECVLPPHQRRGGGGGGYTLAGRGSIFRKTPDIGLASYSIIPLRPQRSDPNIKKNLLPAGGAYFVSLQTFQGPYPLTTSKNFLYVAPLHNFSAPYKKGPSLIWAKKNSIRSPAVDNASAWPHCMSFCIS